MKNKDVFGFNCRYKLCWFFVNCVNLILYVVLVFVNVVWCGYFVLNKNIWRFFYGSLCSGGGWCW